MSVGGWEWVCEVGDAGDATDAAVIRELQMQVRRFDDIVGWLREAITAGDEAYAQLSEEQKQELTQLVYGDSGLPSDI